MTSIAREIWCSREDSNLHGLPHTVLSRTRLPIPPRERGELQCAESALMQRFLRFAQALVSPGVRRTKRRGAQSFSRGGVCARGLRAVALCALCRASAADRRSSRRQFHNLPAVDQSFPPNS